MRSVGFPGRRDAVEGLRGAEWRDVLVSTRYCLQISKGMLPEAVF